MKVERKQEAVTAAVRETGEQKRAGRRRDQRAADGAGLRGEPGRGREERSAAVHHGGGAGDDVADEG